MCDKNIEVEEVNLNVAVSVACFLFSEPSKKASLYCETVPLVMIPSCECTRWS